MVAEHYQGVDGAEGKCTTQRALEWILTMNRSYCGARSAMRGCVSVSHYCHCVGRSILIVLLAIAAIILEEKKRLSLWESKDTVKAAGFSAVSRPKEQRI